eukprot:420607_1
MRCLHIVADCWHKWVIMHDMHRIKSCSLLALIDEFKFKINTSPFQSFIGFICSRGLISLHWVDSPGDDATHILTAVSTCHIKSTRPQREGTPGFYIGGSSILKELIAHQSEVWQDHTTKIAACLTMYAYNDLNPNKYIAY